MKHLCKDKFITLTLYHPTCSNMLSKDKFISLSPYLFKYVVVTPDEVSVEPEKEVPGIGSLHLLRYVGERMGHDQLCTCGVSIDIVVRYLLHRNS